MAWKETGGEIYSGAYYRATTLSPGLTEVTPSPTDSTIPAPSWPRTIGKAPSGSLPERVYASTGSQLFYPRLIGSSTLPTGMADASIINLYSDFICFGCFYLNILDRQILPRFPSYSCLFVVSSGVSSSDLLVGAYFTSDRLPDKAVSM